MKRTFFGGKNGYDVICFNNRKEIVSSGSKREMLKLARKNNYAVAKIVSLRFRKSTLEDEIQQARGSYSQIKE